MNGNRRTWLRFGLALVAAVGAPAMAEVPATQMRMIVPFAPGGASDTLARALAQRLAPASGSARLLVENRPGGGTVIGTQAALAAPSNGQTLLLVAASFVIQPRLMATPGYDARRDFVPVILAATNPHVLVVHPSVPANTFSEFVVWSKAQRGAAAYASFGSGSSGHLAFELLKKAAGIDLVHVPYKGSTPALQDLIGGQVAAMLTDLPQALPHIKSGRIKAIALSASTRDAAIPNVPTLSEAGLAGFESSSWFGFVLRAGTPVEDVRRLNAAINAALLDPQTKASLESAGLDLVGGSPERFGEHLARESKRYNEAVQFAGLKPE